MVRLYGPFVYTSIRSVILVWSVYTDHGNTTFIGEIIEIPMIMRQAKLILFRQKNTNID